MLLFPQHNIVHQCTESTAREHVCALISSTRTTVLYALPYPTVGRKRTNPLITVSDIKTSTKRITLDSRETNVPWWNPILLYQSRAHELSIWRTLFSSSTSGATDMTSLMFCVGRYVTQSGLSLLELEGVLARVQFRCIKFNYGNARTN